jgi:glycosyltransferase involved in cell wall biosynthesis
MPTKHRIEACGGTVGEVRRVLIYSDAAEFGGHEAMTLRAIESVVSRQDLNVYAMCYRGNTRFMEKLEELRSSSKNLTLQPLEFRSRSLQNLRSLLIPGRVRPIQTLMSQANPDVVVVSQGRIEIGSAGLLAAKRAGLRTISYIPMAHPVSVAGKQVAVHLRDTLNRHFYSLPDKFITISEGVRQMLLARGVRSEIAVVPNCIDRIEFRESTRQEFRKRHGLKKEDYVVGIVGRIIFGQKAQDFVVESIVRFRETLRDFMFLFIGDGRDEGKLRNMIAEHDLEKMAAIVPWSPTPGEVYAGIDMLLIPSNFEGVPLVMLEAMSCGLPIVASNVDGMAESLPQQWLFPQRNSCELAKTLIRVRRQEAPELLEANRTRVADQCDIAKFGLRFSDAVLE